MRILYMLENILLRSKMAFEKKDAVDQIVIIFIIIAVAAGIAGLLYFFGTKTFLPSFEGKITNLVNGWFDSK